MKYGKEFSMKQHLFLLAVSWFAGTLMGEEVGISASRVAMSPGEEQFFSIEAFDNKPFEGTLKVYVAHSLSERIPLLEKNIRLNPGKKEKIELKWTAPAELWGANAVAELRHDGKPAVSAACTFTVHRNIPMASSAMGTLHSLGKDTPGNREKMKRIAKEFADSGISIVELYSWTPDLWGKNIVPSTDAWKSGQGNFQASEGPLRAFIDAAHSYGIKVYTYAQPCYSSMNAAEYQMPRKDFLLYRTPDGKPDTAKNGRFRNYANILNKECLDEGLAGYAEVIRRYNFDGIRWDGHPGIFYSPISDWITRCNGGVSAYPYDQDGNPILSESPDRTNTLLVRYLTKYLNERKPGLLHGYNLMFGSRDESPSFFPNMFRELSGGNLVLQERHFHANQEGRPYFYMNQKWSSMISDLVYASDTLNALGGYLYRGDFTMGYNIPFLKHAFAFHYAAGSRLFAICPWYKNVSAKPPFGLFPMEYCRFALRFNKYLLNPALVRFNPQKPLQRILVSAKNPFPVIYEDFCYDLFADRKMSTVINLLNRPASDQVNTKTTVAPPWTSDDTVVSVRTPLGINPKTAKYYALSPEWPEMIREIRPEDPSRPVVNLPVPTFQYWCVVVCDYPLLTGEKPVSSEGELFLPVLHRLSDPL